MASAALLPLDDAFVTSLRATFDAAVQLSPAAHQHWQALLTHFAGRSSYEITAYIAQNFSNNIWTGNEAWFRDPVIQQVFRGYDRTLFNAANLPPLDDVARSHYNPSNTLGRGNLFPAVAASLAPEPVLSRDQFNALSPAERLNYQLTSVFGGYRFQRVPGARPPVAVAPGGAASNASGTGVPPLDNSITGTPITNTGGIQGTNAVTPIPIPIPLPLPAGLNPTALGGTNPITPPVSTPSGVNNNPQPPRPGATSGQPGSLPGPNTGIPPGPPVNPAVTGAQGFGGSPGYPDLTNSRYGIILPANNPNSPFAANGTPSTGANPPVTPGVTTASGGNISGTGGTTSGTGGNTSGTAGITPGTVGTTPGTAGPQAPGTLPTTPGTLPTSSGTLPPAPGTLPLGGQPGGGINAPAGPGLLPNTPGSSLGVPAPPPGGTGFLPGTPGSGLLQPGGPPAAVPGSGLQPVAPQPLPGGTGFQPMVPGGTPAGPSVPPVPPGPPVAPPADGSVPAPMQPSAADLLHSFTWRGQAQPPVGARLRAAQILLDEGDIDREMHWERNVREVHDFLNWLLSSDEAPRIGPESRHMAEQLLETVQAHNLFNNTHYGPNTPNRVVTSDMIPARRPRLKYNGKLPLLFGRDHNDQNHLLPGEFPTHPRAETVVNDMWLTDVEKQDPRITEQNRSTQQDQLSHDEEALWQAADQAPDNNAALVQEQTFDQCIARDGIGFQGWVESRLVDGANGLSRRLFDGAELGADKLSYARERACRRAGLQAALRQFSSHENTVANTPWRRVRLALSAEEVGIMRKNTGAGPTRKYELAKLRPNQLEKTDGKEDPQGFTANMVKFWADRNRDMATAREAVVSRLGFGLLPVSSPAIPGMQQTVLPPMSLWGAYVDSGLSATDEYHRHMLRELRTTRQLFERELKIAPRPLLAQMDAVYQKGFSGADSMYTRPGQQERINLLSVRERDLDQDGNSRDLDKMEIYWIRFLLTQSITPEMTHRLEPRASMFILFADKLARIFNDVSDPLFPDNGTRVSVEDLLDYIHDKMDGPVTRIRFYPHDVQMWLERLHSQGRCRYQEDWRCYGWVQRPVPACHPEQLVRWTVPDRADDLRPLERVEDAVSAPRFDRLRTWHSLVSRCLHNSPLDQRVEQYFLTLAYRWGYYMGKLTSFDGGLEQTWKRKEPRQAGDMSNAIQAYKAEFNRITQWDRDADNPLVRLVKATLPDTANDNAMTADAALQLVRDHIIKEAVKKDSMLWPGRRANDYLDPLDEKVRSKVWSWARPEVRGKVKRFFSVNRWPLQLQTERRQGIITRDEALDEDLLWKPELEDPTPSKYYRPKARPYIDERVEFRSGHRNFLIGDTPRQKQFVIDRMFAQMGRAMAATAGTDHEHDQNGTARGSNSIGEKFQQWSAYLLDRYNSFFDDDDDDHDHDDDHDRYEEPGSRLRKFHRDLIPVSVDPRRKRDADGDAADQGVPKRQRRDGPEGAAAAAADAGTADEGGGALDWLGSLSQIAAV